MMMNSENNFEICPSGRHGRPNLAVTMMAMILASYWVARKEAEV
jgi:hypothetical protein